MNPLQFLLPGVRPWCGSAMCKRLNRDLGPHKATHVVEYRCPCRTIDTWCEWRLNEHEESPTGLIGHFAGAYDCGLVLSPQVYLIGE